MNSSVTEHPVFNLTALNMWNKMQPQAQEDFFSLVYSLNDLTYLAVKSVKMGIST